VKKAILINDTSFEGHHGCSYVKEAIVENLRNNNYELSLTVPVNSNWKCDNDFFEAAKEVDLIIVNGEGTIHHSSERAENIISISFFSYVHRIRCVLINATYEDNNHKINNFTRLFDAVYVRENKSYLTLNKYSIDSNIVPDLSYYVDKPETTKSLVNVGVTDSVFINITDELYNFAFDNNFKFLPILSVNTTINSNYSNNFIDTPESYYSEVNNSLFLISGRYHAICMAIQSKTPFYAISSNTYKIEGMLEDAGLELSRLKNTNQIRVKDLMKYSDSELQSIDNYLQLGRDKIIKMFDDICKINKYFYLDIYLFNKYLNSGDRVLIVSDLTINEMHINKLSFKIDNIFCSNSSSITLETNKNNLIIADSTIGKRYFQCVYNLLLPGGRLILNDEYNPLLQDCKRSLLFEECYRDTVDFFIFIKSPFVLTNEIYKEKIFQNISKTNHHSLSYKYSYKNPWLQHTMVTYNSRIKNNKELLNVCNTVLKDSQYTILECAAALTVKSYSFLEKNIVSRDGAEEIIETINNALVHLNNNEPENIRWFVSLSFVRAKLYQKIGFVEKAIESYKLCTQKDIFIFGVHLATKVTEAYFYAGELSYTLDNQDDCKKYWNEGIQFGEKLQEATIKDILINIDYPNLFDHGDGIREYILAWDWIARCANGIHLLQRNVPLKENFNGFLQASFKYQYDKVLEDAHDELESRSDELKSVRSELVERTKALTVGNKALEDAHDELESRSDELKSVRSELVERTKALTVGNKALEDAHDELKGITLVKLLRKRISTMFDYNHKE
jgi:hypothetical protein